MRKIVLALSICIAAAPSWAANAVLKEIENAFIEVSAKVRPCVVHIEATQTPSADDENRTEMEGLEEMLRRLQPQDDERNAPRPPMKRQSAGSGFIIDKEGHILTNNHVIDNAAGITVRLYNDHSYPAKVVGQDNQTDIAIIKIEPTEELPLAVLGDSDALQVGQFTVAAGSPFSLDGSLSFGHITALGRDSRDVPLPDPNLRFFDFIQTDAAINLGNSGGPLCNIDGEVVGINVAIVWSADALAFSIPINRAKKVMPQLLTTGKVTRGYLGVIIEDAKDFAEADGLPDGNGAYIRDVAPDGPAAKAGVKVYDVIRKVNGTEVKDASGLQNVVADLPPGAPAALEVLRDGQTLALQVMLNPFPDNPRNAMLGEPVLGMHVIPLSREIGESAGLQPGTVGLIVDNIVPNSPADEAEIAPGDIILEVAKTPVGNLEALRKLITEKSKPGKPLLVRLVRQGSFAPILVTIKPPLAAEEGN